MNIWSTLVDLSMRKHFILILFWMFLEAHSTPFSQQVLTRIIIIFSWFKSMILGLSYAVSTLFWRFLHKKIRFFEISLLFENKTNFVLWECFLIAKNAFKHGLWKFNNCTWPHLVAYFHEYEIFRDDEVVKRYLFLSLETILMIIETCAYSSTASCALKLNHFYILKVKCEEMWKKNIEKV